MVLPDNGVGKWTSSRAFPNDGRFPLIRNAHRRHISRSGVGILQSESRNSDSSFSDLNRIMLHPSRPREYLAKLLLRRPDRTRGFVENDRARRRGALIDCED